MTPTHTDYEATMNKLLMVNGLDGDKEYASIKHTNQAEAILWVIGPQLTSKSKQTIQDLINAVRRYVNCMLVPPNYTDQTRLVIQHTRLQCHDRVKESKSKVVWEWVKG